MINPFTWLLGLPRDRKRWLMVAADLVMLPLALWSAYMLRFAEPFPAMMQAGWPLFLLAPLAGILIFVRLGLYRAVVRYMGARAIWTVSLGVLMLAAVLLVASFFTDGRTPRSVPIIFAAIAFVYVGGSRFLVRAWYHAMIAAPRGTGAEPVIIFGAGVSGAHLAKHLKAADRHQAVAFLDEEPSLRGSVIDGIEIHGPEALPQLLKLFPVRRVLLAVPSASRAARRRILDLLTRYPVYVQTIPSMDEMVAGGARANQLRDIDIGDLLGRDPVPPVPGLMAGSIRDRAVMISGAGGSIGAELCRKVLLQAPSTLVLFERNEFALYTIERELRQLVERQGIPTALIPVLGSVASTRRVQSVLRHFQVQTVYHAAAYKHVPMVEHNILEGIQNNVFGTRILAEAAAECGVGRFVLISTDKAVRPSNVMGATKRLAELVLQDLASRLDGTVFTMVRFGNVLGSSGSVVPLFHRQISEGGPITVTHPEITRYFMTISEAADLVIQAGSMAVGGEVYVLDMGEPVRIIDLARRMIRLHGLQIQDDAYPNGDIRIQFTGLRPGEKLFEELLIGDNATGTAHPKILRADEKALSREDLNRYLQQLQEAVANMDPKRGHEILREAVAEFQPMGEVCDWVPAPRTAPTRYPVQVYAGANDAG
jgi:FlaA1/EpsC-like NDP-sugar epimerase